MQTLMALLRFPHSISTTHFPSEKHLSSTPLPNIPSIYNLSFSWSVPSLSLAYKHSLFFKTKGVKSFILRFSSTAQEQALDSVSAQSKESEPVSEELPRNRLIAQNIPWDCTVEDIRALFEKHGTVLDVEVFFFFSLATLYLLSLMCYGFCLFF